MKTSGKFRLPISDFQLSDGHRTQHNPTSTLPFLNLPFKIPTKGGGPVCAIKACSCGGHIIGEIIAKYNYNLANSMQTFENLLQNYSTEFFDIAHQ